MNRFRNAYRHITHEINAANEKQITAFKVYGGGSGGRISSNSA